MAELQAMFLTQVVDSLYDALLTLAYPQACALCARSIESRCHSPVCGNCWSATRIFNGTEPICWKCGAVAQQGLHTVTPEQIRCRRCDLHYFEVARACGVYEGALRESVLLLKRQPRLHRHLINLLVSVAERPPLNNATRMVPVPLHPEREQRRGFNQALVIARAISPALGLVIDEGSLIRTRGAQKYRAGLDVKGRLDTVAGAFFVRFPSVIQGEVILLIDDVFTTGATASSCADALLSAGAKAVYVLTLARPAW